MIPVGLRGRLLAGLLIAAAASPVCARSEAPAVPGDPSPAGPSPAGPAAAQAGWWAVFRDPGLDALMARLHAANPTIASAAARLAMARADARLDRAAGLPTLDLGGSAAHAAGPLVNAAGQSGDLYTLRASASWELDLLGRLSDQRRAARSDVVAADATLSDVTLLMEAALARAWFARTAAALAAAEAARAEEVLQALAQTAAGRRAAGLVAAADVDTAQDQLAQAGARRRALELARDSAARRIASLVGTAPDALGVLPTALPEPPDIPPDLPADLLGRRPDLHAAQARVAAADARLAAIRKGWLPPIALTAVQGQASTSLASLFAAAGGVFGLGAVLALPVFDGGRHRARVAHGKADAALAEADYRDRVATALREVFDSLQAAQVGRSDLAAARARAGAGEARLALAGERLANGTIARTAWQDAELFALDRREAAHLAQGESLTRLVALQTAIGGGW